MSFISGKLDHKSKHSLPPTPMEYAIKTLMEEYSARLQTTVHRYHTAEKAYMTAGITAVERQSFERTMRQYKAEQTSHTEFLDILRISFAANYYTL